MPYQEHVLRLLQTVAFMYSYISASIKENIQIKDSRISLNGVQIMFK